jgi:hypothetical protein
MYSVFTRSVRFFGLPAFFAMPSLYGRKSYPSSVFSVDDGMIVVRIIAPHREQRKTMKATGEYSDGIKTGIEERKQRRHKSRLLLASK